MNSVASAERRWRSFLGTETPQAFCDPVTLVVTRGILNARPLAKVEGEMINAKSAIGRIAVLVVACGWGAIALFIPAARAAQPAIADAVPDAFVPADISGAKFDGYLGQRIANNAEHRLLTINLDDILA